MMNVGIIGSGASFDRHIRILDEIQDVRIVGYYSFGIPLTDITFSNVVAAYHSPDLLIDGADAMIFSGPGRLHNKLVEKALRKGKHILLHPMAIRSSDEAMQLVKLAREANVMLKVHNVGSINLKGLQKMIADVSGIKFIELHYYRNIHQRTVSNPILEDLLINTQVVSTLVKGQVLSVKAKGLSMLSAIPEIINARLEYNNGCAVNITCNIVAARDDFQATIILKDRCIKYDFISHKLTSWNIQHKKNHNDSPLIIDNIEIENPDPLLDELSGFILSAGSGCKHQDETECGFEPFILTERILEKVRKSVIQYT
ncbi:MAG: Gfo/Idh/MocA family oxidoreductase [Bacteroidales bacterium]|nr:Gfo/Idh/MocA family oxidoreductase [Bacteroidales bacterium]